MQLILRRFNAFTLLGLLIFTWFFIRNDGLRTDEVVHFRQIIQFVGGNFAQDPALTTLPGYHWLMALILKITGSESMGLLRGINVLLGGASILLFVQCYRLLNLGDTRERLLQFAVFPIIFPFFFVIYTDIASLFLTVLGLWLCLKQRYIPAVLVLMLGVAVRQTNVIWMLAIPALTWLQQTHYDISRQNVLAFARRCWQLGLGLLAFATFVLLNQGVAMGDRSMHPPFALNAGNVFFMLFVYSLLLLPIIIERSKENIRFALAHQHVALLLALLLAVYLFTFQNSHPYNHINPNYFIRNWFLVTFTAGLPLKMLFFIPIVLAVLDLARAMTERPALILIVLASVLTLLPSWLIEQRYYITSFMLILLFRPSCSQRTEQIMSLMCALLSVLLIYGIQQNLFFI